MQIIAGKQVQEKSTKNKAEKFDVAGRFELPFRVLRTPTYPLGHAT